MISQTPATILLGISILSMAAAQLLAKIRIAALIGSDTGLSWLQVLGVGLTDPLLWLVGVLIVGSAGCWYLAMARLPVSIMVATASVLAPLVAIGAYIFIGERLTASKLSAIALIAVGVAWLGLQSE